MNAAIDWHPDRQASPITTHYSPGACAHALALCNDLSLSPSCTREAREAARQRLAEFARPLSAMLANVRAVQLHPRVEDGWFARNPSVVSWRGQLHLVHRIANYNPVQNGRFVQLPQPPRANRSYICELNNDLTVNGDWKAILPALNDPYRSFNPNRGLLDLRLMVSDGELCCVAARQDTNPDWRDEMYVAKLTFDDAQTCRYADIRRISEEGSRCREKNWTPLDIGGEQRFIKRFQDNVLISAEGNEVSRVPSSLAVDHLRGGSQAIPFAGGWLTICHELIEHTDRRQYLHRFAWLGSDTVLQRLSEPFKLRGDDVEFVTGLAVHPDRQDLVISYGLSDAEGWLSRVPATEVASLLHLDGVPCVPGGAESLAASDADRGGSLDLIDRLC